MKHVGDITKLSGYTLPAVDVITGGSPCQDLSVAGKRAGLAGERSGLFMEQIRIVKEMRDNDIRNGADPEDARPRYMVWENVPGAFSSNGGKDFRAVLTEIARVAEPDAPDVPLPEKGKWSKAGCLYGAMGEWSIAWRVHDAQFWGVPQRRKRISLVADFGGLSAPEILFEREGLSGDPEPCREAGQETAGAAGGGVEGAGGCLTGWDVQSKRIFSPDGKSGTLNSGTTEGMNIVPSVLAYGIDQQGGSVMGVSEDVTGALRAEEHGHQPIVYNGENITSPLNRTAPQPGDPCHTLGTDSRNYLVYENHSQDSRYKPLGDISETVSAKYETGGNNQPLVVSDAVCVGNGQLNQMSMAEQANTLDTMHDQQAVMVSAIVRRLTPLECERLQGYPDGWTDIGEWVDSKGKKHKDADSPRYKALGNSIALPFWQWMFGRIVEQYPAERRDKLTLGSLFDGIGGFPLTAQRNGIEPVWASEIEEFPTAVTKVRFPDEPV